MSSRLKAVFTLGLRSKFTDADEMSAELREHSIQLHLDTMTNKLVSFVSGVGGHGDQLISHIALACRQVNDHCVVANVEKKQKIGPTVYQQANVQKVMYYGGTVVL